MALGLPGLKSASRGVRPAESQVIRFAASSRRIRICSSDSRNADRATVVGTRISRIICRIAFRRFSRSPDCSSLAIYLSMKEIASCTLLSLCCVNRRDFSDMYALQVLLRLSQKFEGETLNSRQTELVEGSRIPSGRAIKARRRFSQAS